MIDQQQPPSKLWLHGLNNAVMLHYFLRLLVDSSIHYNAPLTTSSVLLFRVLIRNYIYCRCYF